MTKRENDAIWAAAEEANRKFGQWMPQLWIEIFIKELASTPPATPAGFGADEIARLQRCLNTLRPFTSRLIGGEGSPARLEQQDRAKAFEEANAILALLSRAGDQK